MAKKNRKNDKTVKKDEQTEIKNAESSQKDKQQNKAVNIHYPVPNSSLRSDKNLIIVIICFIIIFSIVIIEKNCYTKSVKESENTVSPVEIPITPEPLTQFPAVSEIIKEEPKIPENKQVEKPKDVQKKQTAKAIIEVANEDGEEPMFTIEPLKEERPYEEKFDTIDVSQEPSAIILDFDSDYQLTKNHKSYLIEKLDTAKKLGHSNNVVIYGYVSDKKIEEDNINQSLKMANLVAEYLTKNGYIPVSVQGKGSEDLEDNHIRRKVEVQLLQYR